MRVLSRQRLTAELRKIGAEVHVLDLPTGDWNGPDDHIGIAGDEAFAALFDDQKVGAAVLGEVERFLRRFMVMTEAQFAAVTLWIAHTHAIDACVFTPYLWIGSAEKRCAKSRLLEVLFYLVRRPWNTSGVSGPTLFRGIDAKDRPTLLLDEVDTLLKGNPETVEAIRGLLNTGNKVGGTISRCVGKDFLVKDFNTFSPKAVAGIGNLPDTIKDRSLPIKLQRKLTSNKVERLRARLVKPEADPLRERLKNWVEGQLPQLTEARPQMPEELNDRQMDGAEILFSLAAAGGGDWPDRVRRALLEIFGAEDPGDDSAGMRLLVDLRAIFAALPEATFLPTDRILEELKAIEASPWTDWSHGKGLTRSGLAKILKPFGVFPGQFQGKGARNNGYRRQDLTDTWERFLPPSPLTPALQSCSLAQTNKDEGPEGIAQPCTAPLVQGTPTETSLNKDVGPARLQDLKPGAIHAAPETKANGIADTPSPLPEPTPFSETVARLRRRFHYGEDLPAAAVIPCPPEVLAAVPPDDPVPPLPATSPEMLAASETIREHFAEQEAVWRANPHAPPIMPDTSAMVPFLTAQQIELTGDRQIFYGKPPDLRPGRGCDVGMADDEDRRRRDRTRARRGMQ